jgi:hypothetical protein
MESTVGASISSHSTSNSTESTPQKLTAAAFDALVRENKNLIDRVIMLHPINIAHSLNPYAGHGLIHLQWPSCHQPHQWQLE